jgi:TPR repeat protein
MVCAFLAVACSKLSPIQEHFDRAYKAYNKGDFTSAILYLKPLVESGNPAAQLLMAKMYANGDGVEPDMGKAELLRNLAALQIFKNKDYAPGVLRPANETLASISERLDYYVEAGEGKKAPIHDLSEVMRSLGISGLADLEKTSDPEAMPADVQIPLPPGNVQEEESGLPVPAGNVHPPSASPSMLPQESFPSADSRHSDQISLSIVRNAAEEGDPMAMEFLSAAYAHGFYGLTENTTQAMLWTVQAKNARQRRLLGRHKDPLEEVPLAQLWAISGVGLIFVGAGIWLWRHSLR